MKETITFIFLVLNISFSFAQTNADSRLSAKFTVSQINDLEANHENQVKFWNFYLDNSYEILTVGIKASNYPLLTSIPSTDFNTNLPFDVSLESPDLANFNPLKFKLPLSYSKAVYYQIDSTRIIKFYTKKSIVQLFEQSL